ncbi:MAG: chemotaxis protein CheW [Mojavia pulchra JT2-VF2]|jgi:chemotaxis-related protein WspD|uniref:Chemotaxis protein CheW n=1 Tax=Mojavia pulchra JT2-VF2 TaxID=287848 RepID=A0A951UF77_9NOST|nr:chemotaxis protein CheW [Mojavia pulchra JT2-VF2]
MNSYTIPSNNESCWNAIGIGGDRSCAELSTFTHCRNCPVYSTAGRHLLERTIPENYRHEWTELLAQKRAGAESKLLMSPEHSHVQSYVLPATETLAVVIFRLQREWLALSAQVFKETTSPSPIHTLPHRSNQILRGLMNIRGELQLCISLSNLLNLEATDTPPQPLSPMVYSRIVVVEKAGCTWVFAVDELYGVHRFHRDELRDSPNNFTPATQTYAKGFFHWRSRSLSYLDDELLFTTLSKKVLQ